MRILGKGWSSGEEDLQYAEGPSLNPRYFQLKGLQVEGGVKGESLMRSWKATTSQF